MAEIIKHILSKEQIVKLIKKALSGKIPLASETETRLTYGTPVPLNMLVKIELEEGQLSIVSTKMGKQLEATVISEIKMALEELEEGGQNNPAHSEENHATKGPLSIEEIKTLSELLTNYHALLKEGIINEEEYTSIKKVLLDKMISK